MSPLYSDHTYVSTTRTLNMSYTFDMKYVYFYPLVKTCWAFYPGHLLQLWQIGQLRDLYRQIQTKSHFGFVNIFDCFLKITTLLLKKLI